VVKQHQIEGQTGQLPFTTQLIGHAFLGVQGNHVAHKIDILVGECKAESFIAVGVQAQVVGQAIRHAYLFHIDAVVIIGLEVTAVHIHIHPGMAITGRNLQVFQR